MTRYLIAALLAILAAYGLTEAWPLIVGPTLGHRLAEAGRDVPGGIVSISGTARRAALLTLDGAPAHS